MLQLLLSLIFLSSPSQALGVKSLHIFFTLYPLTDTTRDEHATWSSDAFFFFFRPLDLFWISDYQSPNGSETIILFSDISHPFRQNADVCLLFVSYVNHPVRCRRKGVLVIMVTSEV